MVDLVSLRLAHCMPYYLSENVTITTMYIYLFMMIYLLLADLPINPFVCVDFFSFFLLIVGYSRPHVLLSTADPPNKFYKVVLFYFNN